MNSGRMPARLSINRACRALAASGIVAYPTEGVWGLGCDPRDPLACARLLALKGRPAGKGLILIAADFGQLEPFLRYPSNTALKRAFATWPGPVTWLFPAAPAAPPWIAGAHDRIAVRVTAHPVAAALCSAYGGALVSTSANRAGQAPARTASEVRRRFGRAIDALVPGALGELDQPTPIRDVVSGHIIRA